MTEFVALWPKLKNTYKTLSGKEDKKCKGVKKCILKKTLDFEDYKQCLFAGKNAFRKHLLFHNKLREVYMVAVNKLALSKDDDKLVIQSNGVSTLARGHKNVPKGVVSGISLS